MEKKMGDVKYQDFILAREDIEYMDQSKAKLLVKIISHLGYSVFKEKYTYDSSDSDSDNDDDSESNTDKYQVLLDNNSVFYFPLLHELYNNHRDEVEKLILLRYVAGSH